MKKAKIAPKIAPKKRTRAQYKKQARRAAVKMSRAFQGFDNTKDIDLIVAKGKLFQDIVGFSNERVGSLFANSVMLLQQHRYDEAIKAAEFLIQLNPFVSDFWICLGMAEQANGASKRAREAFLMAQTIDPSRSEPYASAIDCCLDLNDPLQAEIIYNMGMKYAKKHSRHPESKLIMHELQMRYDVIKREVAHTPKK